MCTHVSLLSVHWCLCGRLLSLFVVYCWFSSTHCHVLAVDCRSLLVIRYCWLVSIMCRLLTVAHGWLMIVVCRSVVGYGLLSVASCYRWNVSLSVPSSGFTSAVWKLSCQFNHSRGFFLCYKKCWRAARCGGWGQFSAGSVTTRRNGSLNHKGPFDFLNQSWQICHT